jgi:hypothetical protein
MLSMISSECHIQEFYTECHYAECHYAEWHYAECHYAECHNAECHYAECHAECHYAECRDALLSVNTSLCQVARFNHLMSYYQCRPSISQLRYYYHQGPYSQ